MPIHGPEHADGKRPDVDLRARQDQVVPYVTHRGWLKGEKMRRGAGGGEPQQRSENKSGDDETDPQGGREPEKTMPQESPELGLPPPARGDEPAAEGEETLYRDGPRVDRAPAPVR